MSAVDKSVVLIQVEALSRRKRQALVEMGISKSTYYRWRHVQPGQNLDLYSGNKSRPWNRLTPEEESKVPSLKSPNDRKTIRGTRETADEG